MNLIILIISLTLDSCLQRAETNNYAVRNAELEVVAAKAQQGEALSAYFPNLSVGAFGYHAIQPLLKFDKDDIIFGVQGSGPYASLITSLIKSVDINFEYEGFQKGSAVGMTLVQPIFVGGRVVTANKMAKLGYQAAVAKMSLARRTTAEEVENAYWQVIQLQEKQKTLNNLKTLLDTLSRDVESAYAAGLATENDRLQVKLKQGELRSGLLQVNNGIILSRMNLFNLIDMENSDSVAVVCDEVVSDVIDENQYTIGRLPEEELLDMQVRAKELERRMTIGEALPTLMLGATYGYSHLNNKDELNGAACVMLNIPITDWGRTARKMQRQQAAIDMAKNERDYYAKQLELQKMMLSMNVETAREQLKVAEEMVATARSSYKIQNDNYNAGLIPLSELLITQSSLRDAEESLVSARIAYYKALNAIKNRKG